jgi:hypothetical protein
VSPREALAILRRAAEGGAFRDLSAITQPGEIARRAREILGELERDVCVGRTGLPEGGCVSVFIVDGMRDEP